MRCWIMERWNAHACEIALTRPWSHPEVHFKALRYYSALALYAYGTARGTLQPAFDVGAAEARALLSLVYCA